MPLDVCARALAEIRAGAIDIAQNAYELLFMQAYSPRFYNVEVGQIEEDVKHLLGRSFLSYWWQSKHASAASVGSEHAKA